MSDLPLPLTPSDCDLHDFAFMPLDVARLRDSDLAANESPEACWAAVLLWCASWHQIPSASLPNDDRVLAKLAGFGRVVKEFQKIKQGAMRGWVKCSDGRFYHPVIAEKAVDAWNAKLKQRWITECARIKKHNDRHKTDIERPTMQEWLSLNCPQGQTLFVPKDKVESPRNVPRETHSKREGEGQREGEEDQNQKQGSAATHSGSSTPEVIHSPPEKPAVVVDPPFKPPNGKDPIETRAVEMAVMLRARGAQLNGTDPNVLAWARDKIPDDKLIAAMDIATAKRSEENSNQPIKSPYLDGIIRGIIRDEARPKKKREPPWWLSEQATTAKGREVDVHAKAGESWEQFRSRITSKIAQNGRTQA